MTKRKTLSLMSLGAVALLLGSTAILAAVQDEAALANEVSDMRSFVLSADAIKKADDDGEYAIAGGLRFSFTGANCSDEKITISGGELKNLDLAGSKANAQGRIGTGFKKVSFQGLENNAGFSVSFMSGETTLESKDVEAGSATNEVSLNVNANADRVKLTFNSGTGVSFTSIAYFYTCGSAT